MKNLVFAFAPTKAFVREWNGMEKNMNKLYLLCGKPGCGKTTLAKRLNKEYGAIHLSADDFMLKLFGEIADRKLFEEKSNATKNLIYELCKQLLVNNDVVLDFGFWTKDERNYVKLLFGNSNVILVYMKLDNKKIFNQIQHRNENLKENEYFMDKPTFDFLSSKFEEPTEDENPIIYSNENECGIFNNKISGVINEY